jgi:alpha-L-fucosidase 2
MAASTDAALLLLLLAAAAAAGRSGAGGRSSLVAPPTLRQFFPPIRVPCSHQSDAPLAGDGLTGVQLAGPAENLTLWVGRNDFWRNAAPRRQQPSDDSPAPAVPGGENASCRRYHDVCDCSITTDYPEGEHAAPMPIGGLSVQHQTVGITPSYTLAQDTERAELRGQVGSIAARVIVAMDEAQHNASVIIVEVTNRGGVALEVKLQLFALDSRLGKGAAGSSSGGDAWASRTTSATSAAMVMKLWGGVSTGCAAQGHVVNCTRMLSPRQTVSIAIVVGTAGLLPSAASVAALVPTVLHQASTLVVSDITRMQSAHAQWWSEFWTARGAVISLPTQPLLSKFWYASQYLLASISSSMANATAPGLWGAWGTSDFPAWHGGYTLDYNFESTWQGVYSSDRIELARPFYSAIRRYSPWAKRRAMDVYNLSDALSYPVAINPLMALGCANPLAFKLPTYPGDEHERFLGVFASINFVSHWTHTRDARWLTEETSEGGHFFSMLTSMANLYLESLRFNTTTQRYDDLDDCALEMCNNHVHDPFNRSVRGHVNPSATIALLTRILTALIDMADAQPATASAPYYAKWKHALSHMPRLQLAPWDAPNASWDQLRSHKLVILPSSDSKVLRPAVNTPYMYPMYPGVLSQLTATYPNGTAATATALLAAAKATLDAADQWSNATVPFGDVCAFATLYPAAARIGYNATALLARLNAKLAADLLPNGLVWVFGGGLETLGVTVAINEMLLQD